MQIFSSMWIRNQLDVTLCYPLFLFYLLNMFRATMCPSSGADDCVMLSPRVGIVPWLQEGCQDRLAGSASMDGFVAALQCQHVAITLRSRQLLKIGTWLPVTCWASKREIKDNTKVTSGWFLIHIELRCTVNHTSDLYLFYLSACSDKKLGWSSSWLSRKYKWNVSVLILSACIGWEIVCVYCGVRNC